MHIAFISYEYPPDTAFGGIATYVKQAASLLSGRGHAVEVFAGSETRTGTENENGILVHRIQATTSHRKDQTGFAARIAPVFAQKHKRAAFDVLEGPDYLAEARGAIRAVPDIPLVIKLHTPCYLLRSMNTSHYGPLRHTLAAAKSVFKGEKPFVFYKPEDDIERLCCLQADEIAAPSHAVGEKVLHDWGLDPKKVSFFPLFFTPEESLLQIPVETNTNIVTYYGRLEIRKGVVDLADAIPLILRECPAARFQFVGRSLWAPRPRTDMKAFLAQKLAAHTRSVEFLNPVPPSEIPTLLAETDICVFPSLWESFGYTCLESMSAGRGVVATDPSGMAEMLREGDKEFGRLVPPRSPAEIARAVVGLLQNPEERMRLGAAARARALDQYSLSRVGTLQEASYLRAIQRRTAAGPRPATS